MTHKNKQSIINHLIELRKRIIYSIVTVMSVFITLVYFSNRIYQFFSMPLVKTLPIGSSMIATDITSPFLIPIKLTMIISIFISMPMILYQIWSFIAPALYVHERNLLFPLIILSTILFYIGMAFSYFFVFPLTFNFFSHTGPQNVLIATDINKYLNFIMRMFMIFGIAFEIPIFVTLACWTGIVKLSILKQKRPYIFILCFIFGMLLTPPDIFSQIFFAIPVYCLFEVGLFCGKFYTKVK